MALYIGVDVGGTNIKGGVVDEHGKILFTKTVSTLAASGVDSVVGNITDVIEGLIEEILPRKNEISHIGIGCAGDIDQKNGVVLRSCNLGFNNIPIKDAVEKKMKIKTYLENDSNCAAIGEYMARKEEKIDHLVGITVGTGIGAGIIINQRLYNGCNGGAGEIGHMQIVEDGELCGCGQSGCFEAQASVRALKRYTAEQMKKDEASLMWEAVENDLFNVSGKTAFDAARHGDKSALLVVDRYTTYLGVGIANAVNILSPDILVIGGAISKEGDFLLDPILQVVERKRYKKTGRQTRIVTSKIGNDAGIIGSAFLPMF